MEARILYKEKTYTFEHTKNKQLKLSCYSSMEDVNISFYIDGSANSLEKSINLKFTHNEAEVIGQILLAFSKLRSGLVQTQIELEKK